MPVIRKFIASIYRVRMKFSKVTGKGVKIIENINKSQPILDFYSLQAISNDGHEISFENYRGKKVLIVNLASQCGFTPQYQELEKLHLQNENIEILGFPSNNFGGQEPGTDDQIAAFCKVNFGVTFQLFRKNDVTGANRQPVYQWLTDETKNGWNNQEPRWNFYKYLVDENGNLANIFSSSVSPLDMPL
jgi:glutathione peroxidase